MICSNNAIGGILNWWFRVLYGKKPHCSIKWHTGNPFKNCQNKHTITFYAYMVATYYQYYHGITYGPGLVMYHKY